MKKQNKKRTRKQRQDYSRVLGANHAGRKDNILYQNRDFDSVDEMNCIT